MLAVKQEYSAPAENKVLNSRRDERNNGKAYHYCTGRGNSSAELHKKAVSDAISRRSKSYADKLDLLQSVLPETVSPSDSEPDFIQSI